jgi:hypothetical protein
MSKMKSIKRIVLFPMLIPVFAMGAEPAVYCNPLNLNYQVQHPNEGEEK